jgi:hypothetical protein
LSELPVGIEMPQDFPDTQWVTFQKQTAKWTVGLEGTHQLIAGGWNGLAYRYAYMDRSYSKFRKSLIEYPHGMPNHPERYIQESALFTFTSSAVSSVECGFFALNALCSRRWPGHFQIAQNKLRGVSPRNVCSTMKQIEELAKYSTNLTTIIQSETYTSLANFRHMLNHRAAPSRIIGKSLGGVSTERLPAEGLGMFSDLTFTPEYFDPYRKSASETIRSLIRECVQISTDLS